MPAFVGTVTLRYSRPLAVAGRRRRRRHPTGRLTMHRPRSQLTIAVVALILGMLVVIQLRSQAGELGPRPAVVAGPDVLVANLNARNDQLRREGSSLEVELATLTANRSRGDVSIDEITRRPRARPRLCRARPGRRPGRHDLDPRPDRRSRASRNSSTSCATPAPRRSRPAVSGSSPGSWSPVRPASRPGRWRGAGDAFELDGDRRAGQADRLADAIGRGHRPAGRDPGGRRRHGHAGRSVGAAGHDPDARPGPRPAAPLIP